MSRMLINWFPGHMAKARRWITEVLPRTDLVLEVVDARLPRSSQNPMLHELAATHTRLTVFNKEDLADPSTTQEWLSHWDCPSTAITTKSPSDKAKLLGAIRDLKGCRGVPGKPLRVLVAGIPNVGKSSLVNYLAGRKIARVGDEPAITREHQHVDLKNGMLIIDTPGVLWPKLDDQAAAYRMAVAATIKESILDPVDLALFIAEELAQPYGDRIRERFKLEEMPAAALDLLEALGRKRGFLKKGGVLDLQRTATTFLNEIRSGKLGRLSFETPPET